MEPQRVVDITAAFVLLGCINCFVAKDALLKDSEQAADLTDSIASVEGLDYVMESLALGHVVMDQRAQHEVVVNAAKFVTLEEVNALARSLLSFASDYGREREVRMC